MIRTTPEAVFCLWNPSENAVFKGRKLRRRVAFMLRSISLAIMVLYHLQTTPCLAQNLQATIRGNISETNGFLLADVLITAVNVDTLEVHRTLSSSEGEYILSLLSPGTYRIEAELAGFRKYVGTGFILRVGQNLRLNIVLETGGPAEEIIVNTSASLIELDSTDVGAVIDNQQIVDLPLDGRNALQLSLLLPGTAPSAQGSPGSVRGDFTVNVSGAREDSNNFILDGAFNNDPKLNTFALNPPVDAIREFEILTSTYDASFGRSGGAQVNMALKSGTNSIHGTAYEFFRNGALDARNFFARSEDGPSRYQRNQFGFSLGGPVLKNRTFFFGDYEGRRMREAITQATNVPTALEREGDFSQSIFSRPIDPLTQKPFENDRIPSERISEIGRAIVDLYPAANRSVPGQNYISSPILRHRDDHFDVRLDHAFSDKDALIARYSFSDQDLFNPFSGPSFSRVPGFGNRVPRRAQNILIGEDRTFSAALLNQARLAFNRVSSGSFHENMGNSINRAIGLPELSSNPIDHGLSFITVSDFSPLGDEYNNPQHSVTNVFQFTDTVTHAKNKHLIKFGIDFRTLQQNAFRNVQARGFLAFSDYGRISGNGLADLLLGLISYSGGAQVDNPQHLRTKSWNLFVHDSYRLLPNLTLQLGMRYEYNSPAVDCYDRATTYDPITKTLIPVGQKGIPRSVYDPDRNNWAPRVGISWSLGSDDRTAVHAGYGIYYDQSSLAPGEGLYFNKPYYDFKLYYPLPGFPLTVYDPFPDNYPVSIPGSALGFDRRLRTPYMQQWNLTVERQLGENNLVEIAYVGSKGSKILSARDINQPDASPIQPNPRPDVKFADIIFLESRGNSTYHSLQTRFQRRLSGGLAAIISYTLGKSLDGSSTFFPSSGDANFPQNSSFTEAEKGRSNFDLRHRFSLGYSYEFPFGEGTRFLSDGGLISNLLGGWAMHGIVTLQSGRPFTVALLPDIDNSNTGIASLGFGASNRPNRVSSGKLENPTPEKWFEFEAFEIAEYGSFGNSGRNILDGPGFGDFSVSFIKNSRISEALVCQFRTEFFNAFNHTNFDLPENFLGSPAFGRISSAQSPRRIQFGLKLIF
jgi:hypothetical protein